MAGDAVEDIESARKMGQLQAEIALPLNSKDRLIGILNLGHREGKEMYSEEDIEVLSTLANQAAIAIENARLYENLKLSQSIIRRADRLSSLGMLTAGLAHEIRNPLVAIRTFTQLLPERYQDPEFRESFQSLALKEVDRICGLVNDLLNFARPSTPNVSAQDVNEIVENIARILETEAKEKDVKIGLHLGTGLPKIFIDKEQIKQVCMNLILNAIQSIEGAGAVEIGTRFFGDNGSKRFVQIEVRDTGIGIPEKDIENIFNPFFTTKKDGSGLGLSISHQIVKEHGGYIDVESQVGRGTSFYVRLPVRYFPPKEMKPADQDHEEDPGR
jgi:signal transduction histidine kinase